MLRFRQMKTLQKFVSVHASVHNTSAWSGLTDRQAYRERRSAALAERQVPVSEVAILKAEVHLVESGSR